MRVIQVLPPFGHPIHRLSYTADSVTAVSSSSLVTFPMERCQHLGASCGQCLQFSSSGDPHAPPCAWDVQLESCSSSSSFDEDLVKELAKCPKVIVPEEIETTTAEVKYFFSEEKFKK